jgi:hypothetical protein
MVFQAVSAVPVWHREQPIKEEPRSAAPRAAPYRPRRPRARLVDVHARHELGRDHALTAQRPDDGRHVDRAGETRVRVNELPEARLAARLVAVVALQRELLLRDLRRFQTLLARLALAAAAPRMPDSACGARRRNSCEAAAWPRGCAAQHGTMRRWCDYK